MDNIDLDSMIDRTAGDFASYSEDLIEAVTSDISLPDVDNPELDVDVSEDSDTGLEAHQLDNVDASDNLDNAADNATKDFDPSDNNQSSNVDIVDPSQNQNNNDTSVSDNDNYFDNDSSYKDY